MAEYAHLSIDALRRRLKLKPDDGQAWMTLARALLEQSPGPELSHAIGQCLRYLPDSHQAWILAAAEQQRARGNEAALQWLEHATARNPYRPAPYLALATLRLSRLQLVEALAAVNRAIGIAGETAEALSVRGEINLQGTHWPEALADFRRAEKSAANVAQLMHQIGRCYFGLGDHKAAEAYFRKALARDPRQLKSRFALALSYLKRPDSDKGEAALTEIVRAPGGDPQVRRKAETALAVLVEHRRLEPPLRHAVESGGMSELQAALNDTPGELLQHDEATMGRFRRLASIFHDHSFDQGLLASSGDAGLRTLLEAETLCVAEIDTATLAGLSRRLPDPSAGDDLADQGLIGAWRTIRDRAGFDAGQLQEPSGEAWLRYWHARLLSAVPEARPGQFKAVDAAIPGKPAFSPEFVTPVCRSLLRELVPAVPAGLARALFLYVSLRVLQPFVDGNSRLARFLMNAELEKSGLSTVVIPVSWNSRMNTGLDAVLFEGRLDLLVEAVTGAQEEAARQLRLFERVQG
jgi:tetratricopeptide (TPR) repeat protein